MVTGTLGHAAIAGGRLNGQQITFRSGRRNIPAASRRSDGRHLHQSRQDESWTATKVSSATHILVDGRLKRIGNWQIGRFADWQTKNCSLESANLPS